MQKTRDPLSIFLSILDGVLIVLTLGVYLIFRYIFRLFKRAYISRLARNKAEKLLRSSIKRIDKMDGKSFEIYLSVLFGALGYRAEITQASNDYGADLILKRNFRKIAVQAKCYSRNVSVKAVQEAHASMPHYKAGEAWVVTNSGFTIQARRLAEDTGVVLIGRQELLELGEKARNDN